LSPAAVAGTVGEALTAATAALAASGIETPRLDAELLLADATGSDRAALVARPEAGVEAPAARAFGAMMRRRLMREPVAYILGHKGFRRIEVAVDRRVLIPRPETELLVEIALERRPATVLDVGTGSGAVALAIADELPGARIHATDTSLDALAVAKANRDRLGATIALSPGSLDRDLAFDLVVANLPYVRDAEWPRLAAEIREYEPREALVAGPTGFEAIDTLLGELASSERRPGAVALEVGAGQATTVAELVRRAGYEEPEVRRDLADIERVVVGTR
jgi:release factor glutamine methyltransferase